MDSNAPEGADKRGIPGGWLFLGGMLLLYLVVYALSPQYALGAFAHFLEMTQDILPILLFVFLLLWAFDLVSGIQERLGQLSGEGSGLKGWLLAIGGGILSHGPVYPWYPLLQHLQARGTRPALIAAFLYARSIKLPWLPLMAHYFGLGYMLLLTLWIAVLSIPHGWLVERLTSQKSRPESGCRQFCVAWPRPPSTDRRQRQRQQQGHGHEPR